MDTAPSLPMKYQFYGYILSNIFIRRIEIPCRAVPLVGADPQTTNFIHGLRISDLESQPLAMKTTKPL